MDTGNKMNLDGENKSSETYQSVVDLSKSYEAQISINLIDSQTNTRPENQRTSKAMVWVHFPGLSLEYWDEETLFKLSRALGVPVKVDDATLNYQSGYYARVLVEIDLAKTIPNKLWIITKYGCFSRSVVLTNLPKFCWKCKIVGHQHSECIIKTQTEKPIEQGPSTEKQPEVPQAPTPEKVHEVVMEPFDIAPTPEKVHEVVHVSNVDISSSSNISSTIKISKGKFSPL
ncbi:uncharacterized protein LOC113280550 [Papaver somniferum]|uniref:uncharacterized protein LOC113280550 n=1 Tax=Papaver somniferum TaxID=3469 RepID=UPI000E6F9F4A|nr:uncharacterized protein LOC113280550 [Papaver somniferum]